MLLFLGLMDSRDGGHMYVIGMACCGGEKSGPEEGEVMFESRFQRNGSCVCPPLSSDFLSCR